MQISLMKKKNKESSLDKLSLEGIGLFRFKTWRRGIEFAKSRETDTFSLVL